MRIIPYINFAGQAEEALNFYAEALGGQPGEIMRFNEEMYPDLPDSMKDWVLHAELIFKETAIYLSDVFEPEKLTHGNRFYVHMDCDSSEEIHKVFNALKVGGTVTSELEETFWNAIYGALTDRFGIQWSLNFQKS